MAPAWLRMSIGAIALGKLLWSNKQIFHVRVDIYLPEEQQLKEIMEVVFFSIKFIIYTVVFTSRLSYIILGLMASLAIISPYVSVLMSRLGNKLQDKSAQKNHRAEKNKQELKKDFAPNDENPVARDKSYIGNSNTTPKTYPS